MNDMGIEGNDYWHWSIFWFNMDADIEEIVKKNFAPLCRFSSSATKNIKKTISHNIPERLWESVGADITNKRHYLCIVDYHRNSQT